MSVQLSSDLERSMTDVFARYGEQGADNKAVEFLQTQVGTDCAVRSQAVVFSLFDFALLRNFFFFTLRLPLFTFISLFSAFSSFDGEGQLLERKTTLGFSRM